MSVDVATLGVEIDSSSVKQATLDLKSFPDAASAAERAADKLRVTTTAAGATSEDFTRRVQRTIDTLKFQSDQLTRSSADQERYTALRRAGTTVESAAGQVITQNITALQAHRAAQQAAADATRAAAAAAKESEDNNRRAAAAVQSVVAALEFETAQLGRNSTQRAQYEALRRAGISADTVEGKAIMTKVAALETERTALRNLAVAQEAAAKASAATAGLAPYQRVNLGYQLNDVFTQLASGGSPLMVAAQQGPQITQIFGGLANTLKAIPTPLLVAGGAALAGIASVAVLNSIAKLNDELAEQQRHLTTLVGSRDQAVALYKDITTFASGTGIAVAAAAASVSDFAKATASLGASRQNIVDIASVAEKLTQLSGASPDEGKAASGALADMLKSSTVSAEQLSTVLANVPQIADKIAAGLGVSVTQLRLMATDGDITNRQVFDALLKQTTAVNAEFAQMPKSIGSTFQSLADDLGQVLIRMANSIPLVRQYRDALELAAAAAKGLNQATTPATPAQQLAASGGNPGIFSDATNRIYRRTINPSSYYSALYDLGTSENSDTFAQIAAAAKAANDNLVAAVSLAAKLDPIQQQLQDINKQEVIVQKALADLLSGNIGGLSADEAAKQVGKLTQTLDALRQKALDTNSAYGQALDAVMLRQQQNEIGLTPGQRATSARVTQLQTSQPGLTTEAAQSVVSAEQLQGLDDLIAKNTQELAVQTAITQAMKNGKAAADEAAVAMQILGISLDQLGKITPEAQVKLDVLAQTLSDLRQQAREQATIDASKPLVAQLNSINDALKVVEQGAYAVKKAQAEAQAAANDNGTGGLSMQIFEAQQALQDAQTIDSLKKETELNNQLAAAAGDVAKQKQIQLDYDIKIAQMAAGPGAAAAIAEQMRAKNLSDINRQMKDGIAAQQLDNDLAQQQLDIIRAGSPDMTAQLAMLAKRNDLLKQYGEAYANSPDGQQQIALAGQNARIQEQVQFEKDAADATKRTWQTAYSDIQSAGADAFYNIFNGAGFNAQSVADAMKQIFLRTFAEIAAAAVIRPIITPIFQAGAAAGIIPGGVVPGVTGSTGYTGGGSILGGGGLPGGSILNVGSDGGGGGWLGRQFSSVGSFLGRPISSLWTTQGAAFDSTSYASITDLLGSGTTGASAQAAGIGGLGGISIGQGLGALGGFASGAMTLFGGDGSAGSTVSGIGQMIGAGVSLIPGVGQIAGPLIMLGSSILGSFLGGGQKIPPMPGLGYGQGTIDFTNPLAPVSSGGMAAGANGVGQSVLSLISATGGTPIAGKLFSGTFASGTNHTWNGSQWVGQDYTEANTLSPTGEVNFIGGTGAGVSAQDAADKLAVQIFRQDVLTGAIKGVSDTLKNIFAQITDATTQAAQAAITFANAYDALGKAANPVKDSIDKLNQQFQALSAQASTYGLSLDPINAELQKQTTRTAQDFIDNMLDPLAVQMRALQDSEDAALASAQYINDNITGVYADTNKIVDYYGKQRLQLEDQYYSGAITNLQNLIKSLTYGDLSNASPLTTMAGLRSDYAATLSQALGGDATAISGFSTIASQLATAGQQTFGSTADYEALRRQIIADSASVSSVASGGTSTTSTSTGAMTPAAPDPSVAALAQMVATLTSSLDTTNTKLAETTAQLKRYTAAAKK